MMKINIYLTVLIAFMITMMTNSTAQSQQNRYPTTVNIDNIRVTQPPQSSATQRDSEKKLYKAVPHEKIQMAPRCSEFYTEQRPPSNHCGVYGADYLCFFDHDKFNEYWAAHGEECPKTFRPVVLDEYNYNCVTSTDDDLCTVTRARQLAADFSCMDGYTLEADMIPLRWTSDDRVITCRYVIKCDAERGNTWHCPHPTGESFSLNYGYFSSAGESSRIVCCHD